MTTPNHRRSSPQVEPGCVTPLALANTESCKHVVLLLDAKLQAPGMRFYVHPIVNDASVLLDTAGLDAFLRAVGRTPVYVDLEADPKIDKDNPPDLKSLADAVEPPPKEEEGVESGAVGAAGSSSSSSAATAVATSAAQQGVGGGSTGKKKAAAKSVATPAAATAIAEQHLQLTDVITRTDDLIDMVRCCTVTSCTLLLLLLLLPPLLLLLLLLRCCSWLPLQFHYDAPLLT